MSPGPFNLQRDDPEVSLPDTLRGVLLHRGLEADLAELRAEQGQRTVGRDGDAPNIHEVARADGIGGAAEAQGALDAGVGESLDLRGGDGRIGAGPEQAAWRVSGCPRIEPNPVLNPFRTVRSP